MADGWLWLSIRSAAPIPSPTSTTPAPPPAPPAPRALARPDEHPRRLRREPAQVQPAGLVRAVLRPHHRVHGELEVVGLAPEDRGDGGVLVVSQPEGPVGGGV